MNVLSWLLLGLVAGAVARLVVPGRQPGGCLTTMAVGALGALIGGALGEAVLDRDVDLAFDLVPFLLAVAGAVLLLLALEALRGRRR